MTALTTADLGVDLDTPRSVLLLSIADDELVTGHRNCHWTGVAPSLEEDLALGTIAQDEISHADLWYQVLLGSEGDDRARVDVLGLGRTPDEYRHAVLCERPPRDFAFTLARQWLYDHADAVRLAALTGSSEERVASLSRVLQREERYHLDHADLWFDRLASAGGEPLLRLAVGIREALKEALWLFEPLPGEDDVVASGLLPVPTATLGQRWLEVMVPRLEEAGLAAGGASVLPDPITTDPATWIIPASLFDQPGGRRGVHSTDWTEDAWPEMTELYRTHPGAIW